MFKKLLKLTATVTAILALNLTTNTFATTQESQPPEIVVEVFERQDCKHCQDEKAFWSEIQTEKPNLKINYYDLDITENKTLFDEITSLEKISKSTPVTLINGQVIQGFGTAESTGKVFLDLIDSNQEITNLTFQELVKKGGTGKASSQGATCDAESECTVPSLVFDVPIFGTVDLSAYSLPAMSLILGLIDGFNPCAMWVLVSFLLILTQFGDRKKMLQVAGLFILAETVMYYLILNVWLTTWDFVGLDNIITPLVGLVAVGGGLFFLWEYKNSDGTCKVTNIEQRAKTKSKIQKLVQAEMTIATILGIIGLALSVNIIEFACSIGIPQAFTKILDINTLSDLARQAYMGLYILAYMVDDFIVFGIAIYSIEKIGLTTKYAKASNLIGGILMLILGAILIFKAELLIF